MFGAFRKAFKAGSKEISGEYSKNKDFLEATCAVVALVSFADGNLEKEEAEAAKKVIRNHGTLSKIYTSDDIEKTLEAMFAKAESYSGRIQLMRELDDVKSKEPHTMAEDCYLVGLDIAHADGELEPAEADVLQKIAQRMGVDLKRLGLTD